MMTERPFMELNLQQRISAIYARPWLRCLSAAALAKDFPSRRDMDMVV